MQEQIGQAAGKVWQVLSKKGTVNVSDLPKLTGLKSQIAYQGLGWLAREGKLTYETKGQRTTVSLAPAECCS
ncbi:MAG TPA: winged helix-turn-helix domain-containing protein [Anaerohalosphaeraceae bacterium]|nr:winged helix-turn-helix domain-containing protein [Anaerohalosphaeraceae bacterium]HRT50186.1 winged helix-turn-helix domain-containing protein [Anaerohalosphaeraceae bacterium]HRT86117.1 winged helix-turn-helix domain-containing protein [Anaerohalosphaeraceae bacterium]